jgi:hypothetical protein
MRETNRVEALTELASLVGIPTSGPVSTAIGIISARIFSIFHSGCAWVRSGLARVRAAIRYRRRGKLRPSARELLVNEEVLITEAEGLQTRTDSYFANTVLGTHGDPATKYLWTIDERGINIALESTPFPTPRGNIVHTNLSSRAYIGGEAWFGPGNRVTINAGSGRFGDGAGITRLQWDAAVKYWQDLGYEVNAIPFGYR